MQEQSSESTTENDAENEEPAAPIRKIHYDQPWTNSLLRPALIAIMIACMIVAVLAFMRYALTGIPVLFTSVMIFLGIAGALIGCFSTTLLAQPGQRMRRGTGIRAAEILLLLMLVRLSAWATVGNWPSFNQILTRPIDSLLDAPFVTSAIIVGIGWMLASAMTSDFLKMGLQPDELYAAQQRTGRSTDDPTPPNYTDRRAVLRGFTNKWIMGALVMVLMAAGTQIAPAENGFFALGRQNIDPAVISAVVIYMLTGLILLSQGQLAVLRARWTLDRVPSSAAILRNWPIYTTLLILGVGLLATLLPFGDTFYLSIIISSIIEYTFLAMNILLQLLFGIFFLIAAFFGSEQEDVAPEMPEAAQPIVPPKMELPPEEVGLPPWIGGSIFWVIMALLLGYAAYIYFSGRGGNLNWLRQFWLALRTRWAELFGAYQTWQQNRETSDDEEKSSKSQRSLLSRLTGRIRWQDLQPEAQARYFYLNMLERAEAVGIRRNSGETPLQYAPRLTQTLVQKQESETLQNELLQNELLQNELGQTEKSDSVEEPDSQDANSAQDSDEAVADDSTGDAIHTLTEAFVRTRYAKDPVSKTDAGALKNLWDLITKRLR